MNKNGKIKKLGICLLMDAVGMISGAGPVLGEAFDLIWVPIAASVSYKMFGEKRGKFTSVVTFLEEILPFVDVFPSFTLFFILFDILKIGNKDNANVSDADYIEIPSN